MTATAAREELVHRIRAHLTGLAPIREVSMFGGRAVMLRDKMLVCAMKDGALLVRIRPDRHAVLLTRPGAFRPEMGAGRAMGDGWIAVAAEALGEDPGEDSGAVGGDAVLGFWIDEALAHNREITG